MFEEILKHIEEVIQLDPTEIERFTSVLVRKKLRKRQFLIQEGDTVSYEYFVAKGCLKAYEIDDNGDEHIIQFAKENWWISDFKAFFEEGKATLNIDCIEESIVYGIEKQDLENLFLDIPKFDRFFRIKLTSAFVALQNRILSSLDKSTSERYLDFLTAYPNLEQRIPNYMIANYLGVKPESLSRIRKTIVKG
ncbi:cyclic nucleotide-binding protein [Dokdonia pacifica]|uniref:cAMP-binding domain of CRP or a regulatory subunit of cAMP-dependent protein kinases n=1 Tax=Dokdonia pacifica TaxID=1627892 RepID=A0A238YWD7_9FLAO|nr:Crp/Fnr family transcriptional regulator [Dokdonia pacifica]GGG09954.1 cyclic nucleotide-binding protein [Dokdonia pacifica]SNR74829.1 cAMP-binding domain of CRP or a regulatory subunit of cAMP-dependent protein kinases [Dokdonia pacifica]